MLDAGQGGEITVIGDYEFVSGFGEAELSIIKLNNIICTGLVSFLGELKVFFCQFQCLQGYWAVGKLGFSATELSKELGVSQPLVSISVKRDERIAKAEQLELVEG